MNTIKEYEVMVSLIASNGAEWTESALVEAKSLTDAHSKALSFAREVRNESDEPGVKVIDVYAIDLDAGDMSD
jgi:hypothetical protein